MKNVLHKTVWCTDINPAHVEPPTIPLIKETPTGNSYGDYVKLKLCRDPTSSTLDLYGFRMSLFDHGDPGEFLLFVRNFKMTLASTGTLDMNVKVQYIFTLVRGKVLHQFYLLYYDVAK